MIKLLPQAITDAKRQGWFDWIKSEADERAVLHGCGFNIEAARWWSGFYEKFLRLTMGRWAGQRFKLLDWQRDDIIHPLFGWMRNGWESGIRRYSKGDIFVAKKQGKSSLSAGIVNGFLIRGGQRAEIYGVAHTREQAGIIYREVAAMTRSSPQLSKKFKVLDSRKRIVYQRTGSFYQAMAGESGVRGAEGINPVLILVDEIHVQRSRELYDALTYASAARENSLMLSVSTVGVADTTTIWWEQYAYASGIISGEIHDDHRFAYIAQADEACKDDVELRRDTAQWKKAMPSLGVIVTEEKVREALVEAENSPAKLNNFLRYMLNIPTAQVDRVIPMEKWYACQWDEEKQGPFPDLAGRECHGGLDIASSEDLTAFSLYFPPLEDEDRGFLITRFWCPEEKIREREQKQLAHYGQWVREGHLEQTEGVRIHHHVIYEAVIEDCQNYHVTDIHFDKWNADAVVNPLEADGVEMISTEQGVNGMSAFTQQFISSITDEKIWHDGNPVMAWCCSNAAADTYDDAMRFSKKKSADKIDGVVAGAMAVGPGVLSVETKSFYDTNDLEVF